MSEPSGANRLFAEVERLAALGEPPVHKQHVVSRVLLKRFAERDPRHGLQLLSVDLDHPARPPLSKEARAAAELRPVPSPAGHSRSPSGAFPHLPRLALPHLH